MTRREFVAGAGALALAPGFAAADTSDTPQLAAAKKWFREAQYGMMVHWGLYSMLGGEWKGKRMAPQYIAEWIQQYYRIPNAEYEKLAKAFNPVFFNADEWVQLARDAGMKYLVFTSKHHEGFAMFKSKDPYNIVDATPFRRDVVAELAEACRRHGLKLGLYYSQDLDWHERNGGGWTLGKTWTGGAAYWTNNWDFPDDRHKDFAQFFEAKAKPQVKEILTQYGDLCLIWFDIGATLTADQSVELYDMVRKYQPGCLINSRIGNRCAGDRRDGIKFDYKSSDDNHIPKTEAEKNGMLYESCATTNDSWGFKIADQNWKTPERIRADREHLKALGANYLLNVGPDGLGRIPAPCHDILRRAV